MIFLSIAFHGDAIYPFITRFIEFNVEVEFILEFLESNLAIFELTPPL
jgi:hypothetical protein